MNITSDPNLKENITDKEICIGDDTYPNCTENDSDISASFSSSGGDDETYPNLTANDDENVGFFAGNVENVSSESNVFEDPNYIRNITDIGLSDTSNTSENMVGEMHIYRKFDTTQFTSEDANRTWNIPDMLNSGCNYDSASSSHELENDPNLKESITDKEICIGDDTYPNCTENDSASFSSSDDNETFSSPESSEFEDPNYISAITDYEICIGVDVSSETSSSQSNLSEDPNYIWNITAKELCIGNEFTYTDNDESSNDSFDFMVDTSTEESSTSLNDEHDDPNLASRITDEEIC